MLKKKHKIYIAGHKGLVGNAVLSKLKKNNYKNLLLADKKKLNLLDIVKLKNFFKKNKPDGLIICAAKVGGILENKNFQLDFLLENLQIQVNLIHSAYFLYQQILHQKTLCLKKRFFFFQIILQNNKSCLNLIQLYVFYLESQTYTSH